MCKNYRIGKIKMPKYSGSYRVASKREFEESNKEYKKSLDEYTRLHRRIPVKKQYSVKVAHILCVFAVFFIIWFIDFTSNPDNNSLALINPNSNLQTFKLVIDNTRDDFGNDKLKPKDGNKFFYVYTTLENLSNINQNVDCKYFTLTCDDGSTFKPINSESELEFSSDLSPHSSFSKELIFEVPKNYYGDIRLEFNNSSF